MNRLIVLGASVPHARSAARNYRRNGFDVVAYASMRSLNRLRGVVADQAVVCGVQLSEADSLRLREAAAPCLVTTRPRRRYPTIEAAMAASGFDSEPDDSGVAR